MPHPVRVLAAALALAATGPALAACYTVYDRANRPVWQGPQAPVDMAQPLHEALQQRWPGGHLVFGNEADCPVLGASAALATGTAKRAARTPLLTDEAQARTLDRPHTRLAGGGALVPGAGDTVRPGLTVADSGFGEAGDTRAMGAGASDTRSMGAGPARPRTPAEVIRTPVQAMPAMDAGGLR